MEYKIGDNIIIKELFNESADNDGYIEIDSSKFKGRELKYYQNNLQGKKVNNSVLGEIYLGSKGRGETYKKAPKQYLAVVCFIDKIIETAYCNNIMEDPNHPRNDSFYGFYKLYNEVLFDGKPLGVTVTIGCASDGFKYYLFNAYTNESSVVHIDLIPKKDIQIYRTLKSCLPIHPTDNSNNLKGYQVEQTSNNIINPKTNFVKCLNENVTDNEEIRFTFIDNPQDNFAFDVIETDTSYNLRIADTIIESGVDADSAEYGGYFSCGKQYLLSELKQIIQENNYFYDHEIPYHDKVNYEVYGLSGNIDFSTVINSDKLPDVINVKNNDVIMAYKIFGVNDKKGNPVALDIDWKRAKKYSNFMSDSMEEFAHTNIITIPVGDLKFIPSAELKERFKTLNV